jgi:hypothetical protein
MLSSGMETMLGISAQIIFKCDIYNSTDNSQPGLIRAKSKAGIAPVDVELGKEALPTLSR